MKLIDFLNENDRFAKQNGIQLTEVREGYARAEMTVAKMHLNGGGVCQGGALFTLADLAFAAVSNSHGLLTLKSAKEGDHLVAEAVETLNHHKIPFCEMKVRNQHGELICTMTGLAFRKDKPMPSVE